MARLSSPDILGKLRWFCACAMAACALAFVPCAPAAQESTSREYLLKAAFIYNFLKFVEWPATAPASGPVAICIYGADPFGRALDPLQQKMLDDRPIKISRVGTKNDHLGRCHVLFIGGSTPGELDSALSAVKGVPVLTIGETANFAAMGGMIELTEEQGKIKFKISTKAAGAASLKVSSKILELAASVD